MGAIKCVGYLLHLDSPELLPYGLPIDFTSDSNNISTALKLFSILIISYRANSA